MDMMGATTLFAQERETNIPADSANQANQVLQQSLRTPKLTMDFRDVPLQSVLEYMSEAAGFIILGDTEVRGNVKVLSKQTVKSRGSSRIFWTQS